MSTTRTSGSATVQPVRPKWLKTLKAAVDPAAAAGHLPPPSPMLYGEAPLEPRRDAGHSEAADKEDHPREEIALAREAEPSLVAQCQVDDSEQVGDADDGDQRRVLEQVDHGVDDGGEHGAQRLWQDDEPLHLPVSQA